MVSIVNKNRTYTSKKGPTSLNYPLELVLLNTTINTHEGRGMATTKPQTHSSIKASDICSLPFNLEKILRRWWTISLHRSIKDKLQLIPMETIFNKQKCYKLSMGSWSLTLYYISRWSIVSSLTTSSWIDMTIFLRIIPLMKTKWLQYVTCTTWKPTTWSQGYWIKLLNVVIPPTRI